MPFDFTNAVNAANTIVSGGDNQKKSYRFPLVYPSAGQTIVIRPLFETKSGQIVRLINRHEKVPCYRTFGQKCPICEVQQQVKDLTGQDPFGRTSASKSRGICFAQFVSSTMPIDKGQGRGTVQPGEIIMFMHPWSVYKAINEQINAIAQTPTGMEQAFTHADSGLYIQVSVTNDFKYTITNVPYMTFNPSKLSDEDFMKVLDNLDDLREQVVPSTITEEVEAQVKEYADNISRKYLSQTTPEANVVASAPQAVSNVVNTAPVNNAPVNNAPTVNADKPDCFGKHNPSDTKCICCPYELQCQEDVPF